MKLLTHLTIYLFLSVFLVNCGGDEEFSQDTSDISFRVIISPGCKASAIFLVSADDQTTVTEDDIKDTWTSDTYTMKRSDALITAVALPDEDDPNAPEPGEVGTLTVQILVDGTVKKEKSETAEEPGVSFFLED